MKTVKDGDTIRVQYCGTFDDGTVFDSSENREPLEFKVGSGQIIKGFDTAVHGMKEGEEKKVHIKVADAYGEKNPQQLRRMERKFLPQDREPQVGMVLGLVHANGSHGEARIIEVTKDDIAIDLNHPLAGKDLNFTIKLIGII